MYGEFPIVTNWTFETRWNPHYPSILATASFDGKITVQTIQNTKATPGQTTASRAQALDGEDFFNSAQTEPQTAAFSLPKPPKWLERPAGASFGFGGKVVSFGADAASRKSTIRITKFAVDGGIGNATAEFEKALAKGDLASICKSRIEEAKTDEERSDWEVLQTLIADNPRRKLVEFLGFSDKPDSAAPKLTVDEDEVKDLPSEPTHKASRSTAAKNNRLSAFFDSSGDGDNFLADLSATKGAKTNNPFQIYSGSESEPDRQITRSLILGQFESAMNICLREDRMSDAFIIAICGGSKCIEQAQAAYFSKKGKGPNYVRLLASVVGKNLWDVVYNADLSNWKEVMATLCTFAGEDEFPDLCEGLGDRLDEELKAGGDKAQLRKDASFCYLAGSKLDKVISIWIEETQEEEAAGFQQGEADSSFSLHARSLQTLIEKVTVFREVTKFEDNDRDRTSGWKLSALYDKYTEYADVVAAHGFLDIAEKYLDLLPPRYAAAEVARNRVKQATRKAAPAATNKQLPSRPAGANMYGPTAPRAQPQAAVRAGAASPYAPAATPQAPAQPGPAGGSYMPAGFQPPQQQQPYMGGNYYPGQGPTGPPRNINASPSVPPPPRNADGNWNDTPMVTKPAIARRSTPGAGGPGQPQYPFNAPAPSPLGPRQRATPPLPPPPKGSAPPPRMISPPTVGPPQQPERPPSVTRNQYAPPSYGQPGPGMAPPAVPRGPSPYNPPPQGAPPTNRYAPAAPAQGMHPPDQGRSMPPPPPGGRPGSQPNPYAPQQSPYAPQQAPYGQQPPMQSQGYGGGQSPQFSQPPPQGPPPAAQRGPSPATAPPPRQQQQSPAPSKYRR